MPESSTTPRAPHQKYFRHLLRSILVYALVRTSVTASGGRRGNHVDLYGLVKATIVGAGRQAKNGATAGGVNAEQQGLTVRRDMTTPVTIVCQLSGELGNNLAKWAHCLTLKLALENGEIDDIAFGNIRLVVRHQEHKKWIRAADDLGRCFPNTRTYDFGEGNTEAFVWLHELQEDMFGPNSFGSIDSLGQFLNATRSYISPSNVTEVIRNATNASHVTFPFVYGDHYLRFDASLGRYYDELRRYFHFDYEECCKAIPHEDESVFHFRNFLQEMPRVGRQWGYSELGPQQVAAQLFGHLHPGSKVAIVTRFDANSARPYVDALEKRNLTVRVIDGQTGTQDFCFLLKATKEIVGISYSTYLFWAGVLSNATRVVAYSVSTSSQGHNAFNWTGINDDLRNKFEFPLIRPWGNER